MNDILKKKLTEDMEFFRDAIDDSDKGEFVSDWDAGWRSAVDMFFYVMEQNNVKAYTTAQRVEPSVGAER